MIGYLDLAWNHDRRAIVWTMDAETVRFASQCMLEAAPHDGASVELAAYVQRIFGEQGE